MSFLSLLFIKMFLLLSTRGSIFWSGSESVTWRICMPFFDPPEFLAEISDQVTQFDFVPLSNFTKFVNQFWFSSNNQRLVHTQIRRVNDHVIDELVELRFWSTFSYSNWTKIVTWDVRDLCRLVSIDLRLVVSSRFLMRITWGILIEYDCIIECEYVRTQDLRIFCYL